MIKTLFKEEVYLTMIVNLSTVP